MELAMDTAIEANSFKLKTIFFHKYRGCETHCRTFDFAWGLQKEDV